MEMEANAESLALVQEETAVALANVVLMGRLNGGLRCSRGYCRMACLWVGVRGNWIFSISNWINGGTNF